MSNAAVVIALPATALCVICGERAAQTRLACRRCYKRALQDSQLEALLAPVTHAKYAPRTARVHGVLEYYLPLPQMRRCSRCGVRAANPTAEDPALCLRCDAVRWAS